MDRLHEHFRWFALRSRLEVATKRFSKSVSRGPMEEEMRLAKGMRTTIDGLLERGTGIPGMVPERRARPYGEEAVGCAVGCADRGHLYFPSQSH